MFSAVHRLALFVGVIAIGACTCTKGTSGSPPGPPRVEDLVVQIRRSYPHAPDAFTQGLLVFDGKLYESTGLVGRSSLRRVDLQTGQVEARVDVEAPIFAEGLARVGGRLYQLSWQNGRVIVWNLQSLKREREFTYEGEGWGLCFDGKRLVMSDGSARLTFRDPESFAKQGDLEVRRQGQAVTNLNELECVGATIYANVWQDDHIVRIDGGTGVVTAWIDAAGLLSPSERAGVDVLNGIAYMEDRGHFLVTGKFWPRLFEVEFVPRSGSVR